MMRRFSLRWAFVDVVENRETRKPSLKTQTPFFMTYRHRSFGAALACSFVLCPADAEILVRSTGTGSGDSEVGILAEIDASGNGASGTTLWEVTGQLSEAAAFGSGVRWKFDAMKNVSIDPSTWGDELKDGAIDRDGNGLIGVQGNPNGGGIGADAENREGIAIRVDEFQGLPEGMAVRITRLNIRNVGRSGTDPVGTEAFTIVNLQTRQAMEVVPTEGSEGDFDVSGLDLVRGVGDPGPVAALISGETGGFRIDGLNFIVQEGLGDLPPVIGSFVANDRALSQGQSVRLSWDVFGADSVTLEPGGVVVDATGMLMLSPTETTTYSLVATNEQGSRSAELKVWVDDEPATPSGPVGRDGIRYATGDVAILNEPPVSVQSGDSESLSHLQLIPERLGVVLESGMEVDHRVHGAATVVGTEEDSGSLPVGTALNSYLFHADLPGEAPDTVVSATVTFDAPILGLVHRTGSEPVAGFANRFAQSDATFGLEGMQFESTDLARRSAEDESVDEFTISPDGFTLAVTFHLSGDGDPLDELRVITRGDSSIPAASAPNIIVFLADDMGMGDTSVYQDWSGLPDSGQVSTPAMERLADLGVRFTDAHAQNRCTPTRYALMTGRYAWRAGLLNGVLMGSVKPPLIEMERPTLPGFLRSQGYATAMVGKWHLGLEYRQDGGAPAEGWADASFGVPMRDTPVDHGFDDFFGFSRSHLTSGPDGQDGNGPAQDVGPGWIENRRPVGATGRGKELDGSYDWDHMGQVMWDRARDFMQTHVGHQAARERPFFLYYASHSNHQVYTPDVAVDGIPVQGESRWKDGSTTGDVRRDFVYLNDVLLGRLMDYLESTEDPRNPGHPLLDNTLLIFASDNGAEINDNRAVGNLRAFKARIYEGGHRVPMMAYWKNGGVGDGLEGNGGLTRDDLIGLQDVFPSVAEILGSPLPAPQDGGDAAVDGFSRADVILNREAKPRPPIFTNEQEGKNWLALQFHGTLPLDPPAEGYWKILFGPPLLNQANAGTGSAVPLELYNLETDRLEEHNLLEERGSEALVEWLSRWAERLVNGGKSREETPSPESSFHQEGNGGRLRLQSEPFLFYELWDSEDLSDWTYLSTVQSSEGGDIEVPVSMTQPQRFYQVRVRQ